MYNTDDLCLGDYVKRMDNTYQKYLHNNETVKFWRELYLGKEEQLSSQVDSEQRFNTLLRLSKKATHVQAVLNIYMKQLEESISGRGDDWRPTNEAKEGITASKELLINIALELIPYLKELDYSAQIDDDLVRDIQDDIELIISNRKLKLSRR